MNILVVRFENFPYGSAPAFRTLQLLNLVAMCGHDITVICKSFNADAAFISNWNDSKTKIKCISVNEKFKCSYKTALQYSLSNEKYDAVIRPTSIRHFSEVDAVIKKYGLPQVFDSVEWYDASNWRLQWIDPRYYYFQYLWRYAFGKANGIIAISRLIQKYYTQQNSNVVRIPTITDCSETPYRTTIDQKKIRFVFAGQLDKGKDNIDTFIEAMHLVDPKGERTVLDVYGPSAETVRKHLGQKAELLKEHKNIIVHGRVPQQEAQNACSNSDFSVFFRLNRRSANAGFPTKLGECMTFGTPAICNNTGDVSLVIKDKVNGFLLKAKSVEEITGTLRYILSLSEEQRSQMRLEARKSAASFFDYRNYCEEMQNVLTAAVKGEKPKHGTV